MDEVSIYSSRPATSPFWKTLEDSFGRNVTQNEWESRLGETCPQIRSLFLEQTTEDQNLEHGMLPMIYKADLLCRREGDPPLDEKYTNILSLNLHALCKSIARGFNLNEKFTETSFASTWQISELSNLPILLTIHNNYNDFLLVVAQLVASLNQPFILLAPTRRLFNIIISELLSRRNAAFFDLESQIAILPNGSLQAHKSGGELFSPYLSEQKTALSENEAVRLFALYEKLKSENNYRKASLHEVFTLLVLDKISQTAAAKKLKCSEGTISARVKVIEDKMYCKIEILRNSASELRNMEIEKDTQARKLYRKGLTDDTKSDDDD